MSYLMVAKRMHHQTRPKVLETHTHTHTHTYTHTYTHIHTYTHTHIHIAVIAAHPTAHTAAKSIQ